MVRGVAAMLVPPARTQNPMLGLERKPPGLQARAGAAEVYHKRLVQPNVWCCKLRGTGGASKGACHLVSAWAVRGWRRKGQGWGWGWGGGGGMFQFCSGYSAW